jgi:hypothetical protein
MNFDSLSLHEKADDAVTYNRLAAFGNFGVRPVQTFHDDVAHVSFVWCWCRLFTLGDTGQLMGEPLSVYLVAAHFRQELANVAAALRCCDDS